MEFKLEFSARLMLLQLLVLKFLSHKLLEMVVMVLINHALLF